MPLYKAKLFFRDAYGRQTTRSAVVSATDPVAADVVVGLWVTDVQAATKLHVYKSTVYIDSDYAGAVTSGANVDEGMTISVLLQDGVKKASIQLPGPVDAIRQPDGTIDLTDTIMTDLEANYTSGNVLISDGEVSDSFLRASLDV